MHDMVMLPSSKMANFTQSCTEQVNDIHARLEKGFVSLLKGGRLMMARSIFFTREIYFPLLFMQKRKK